MKISFLEQFSNPDNRFRGVPFWAWNARLEQEELLCQIGLMKAMKLGGFVMHSRIGMDVPYLQPEWFDCIRVCVEEAEKRNMQVWLYDDDRWPSGYAGGLATRDARFRARTIGWKKVEPGMEDEPGAIARFLLFCNQQGEVCHYRQVTDVPAVLPPHTLAVCFEVKIDGNQSRFNGQSYLDTLNPAAVDHFMTVTHEAYLRENGGAFGNRIEAIFTDEPCFIRQYDLARLPWTDRLPECFCAQFGYDIRTVLPELFFPMAERRFSRERLRYYNCVSDCFIGAFAQTTGKWCEEHQLLFSGHVLREDTMGEQSQVIGSAMRFYEHMQLPGVDLLTEHWNVFNTVKQCVSVARQFGRTRRLSELYGCTGWDFSFEGHKALGDWQFALGINVRCQHLAFYSMQGEAKRDYPASIFYQSPWYAEYGALEDYFARLGTVLAAGKECCDLLVIHPIESLWGLKVCNDCVTAPAGELDENLLQLTAVLLREHLEFDFGDEEIMARNGKIANGKCCLNQAEYKAVLIPELQTIRSSTLTLLTVFVRSGGSVFYLGRPPARMDGIESEEPAVLFSEFTMLEWEELGDRLAENLRLVSVAGEGGREIPEILCHLNDTPDGQALFLCNSSMTIDSRQFAAPSVAERVKEFPKVRVNWTVTSASGFLYELNAADGSIREIVPEVVNDGVVRFDTSFVRLQSRLFLWSLRPIDGAELPEEVPPAFRLERCKMELPQEYWEYQLEEPNVLLLDHAFLDNREEEEYILRIDDHIRRELHLPLRGEVMSQPWTRRGEPEGDSRHVRLDYRFVVELKPEGNCFLCLEEPERFQIILNGQILAQRPAGSWLDHSIKKLEFPGSMLVCGENHLQLELDYRDKFAGLEAIYLLGNFGVQMDRLTVLPQFLKCADWTLQGLPYYSGNLLYRRDLPQMTFPPDARITIRAGKWHGTALEFRLNGGEKHLLYYPPYAADVTKDWRQDGKNTLEVRVLGSRRNVCGPFYVEKPSWWVGPEEFRKYEKSDKTLVPYGLLGPLELEIEKTITWKERKSHEEEIHAY